MTTLAMATVLSLAAQCAPGVAPDTIAAIAMAESGLDPLAIHDNTVQRTDQSANLPDAIAVATEPDRGAAPQRRSRFDAGE